MPQRRSDDPARPAYRLAASNIGWTAAEDETAWELLAEHRCEGIEVAPGRVIAEAPYDHPGAAAEFAAMLRERWGLEVCSLQSLWFGQRGSIYSDEDRPALLELSRQALQFAAALGCANLVFGCPRNRALPVGADPTVARTFFTALGEAAAAEGAHFAIEPNPTIYETNFLNTTEEAAQFVRSLDQPGLTINLDVGTLIANGESIEALAPILALVSHVHVSEPHLVPIRPRRLHRELRDLLVTHGYDGYVSLEMAPTALERWRESLAYVVEVFG